MTQMCQNMEGLFHSFSHIIAGSQEQYKALMTACLVHLCIENGITVIPHGGGTTVFSNIHRLLAWTWNLNLVLCIDAMQ